MAREEVLKVKKSAPPTRLLAKETAEKAEELSGRFKNALKGLGEALAPSRVARLSKSVMSIASTGITLYLMGFAVASMLPYASQGFAVMGQVIGYFLPLMMMVTMLSLVLGLFKRLTG
jgi:hypothetical protein